MCRGHISLCRGHINLCRGHINLCRGHINLCRGHINLCRRILILVFTRMLCGKYLTRWPWPLTLKINRVPDSPKDYVCTKFGQNPLKDVDSRDSQGCYAVKMWLLDLWPWKSIEFQTLTRTMYVPSLVKIHWSMLILECSQGCYAVKIWPGDLDLWSWKSMGLQIILRIKYLPILVIIHWSMLILVCSQGCYGRTDGRKERRTVALLYPFATSLARG